MSLALCSQKLDLVLKVTQNLITKQPSRVIELCFHRFIKLIPPHETNTDFVDSQADARKEGYPAEEPWRNCSASRPASEGSEVPNNIRMLLMEEPVVNNLKEVVRAEDITTQPDDERGGAADPASKEGEITKGSINDAIRNQGREEQRQNVISKYNLFIDFVSCDPFVGRHAAQKRIDINKFGKSVDKEIHKVDINNTNATNKIKFKIFRQGTRQADRLRELGIGLGAGAEGARDETEEVGLVAMAEIDVCDLKGFRINAPLNLVLPVQQVRNSDPQSHQFSVTNAYVLCSLTVTDKAFGELVMDLNEF